MKNLLTLIFVVVATITSYGQSPSKFNYQAVVRDASNGVIANQSIGVKASILFGSETGSSLYTETHTVTTGDTGVLNLIIGNGIIESGDLTTVIWNGFDFFLKIEIDPTGGTNYTLTNTSQLLSVPFALHATRADNGVSNGNTLGDMLYWDGNSWEPIAAGQQGEVLNMCGGIPRFGACVPMLNTNIVSVGDTTAIINGIITNDGGFAVSAKGVVYGTNPNPTTADTVINNTGTGNNYTVALNTLTENTTYYVRAYATNSEGTGYGNEVTIITTCSGAVDVPDTLFVGDYLISNVTNAFNGSVFGDGVTVTLQLGSSTGERKFSAVYLPDLAIGQLPMEFNFTLKCDEVNVVDNQITGLGCGPSLLLGPDPSKGTYNVGNDSVFNIIVLDDTTASCGVPTAAEFTLTKI
ncbi:hypothetical protein [uncultured Lacinutrix sp.]|uniref:hypothetical protein n=1 Tax=uncultured Lacinutrix sp. TaxID=574032 RepID=UPI002630C45F|nr:hypothetical protein [uncultured Lacinutrix sp.]